MAKDPMKKTDMEIAHNAANAMSGYSGPSTAKQQQEMAKYGTAPEGQELYTIKGGKAVYKTKEEIAALDKNIPDYSNPNDRAEINYKQREAVRKNESQQAANMRESSAGGSSAGDARFLQTLSRLNARPDRTSATEPTQTPPLDLPKIAKESRAANASPLTTTSPVWAPLGSGSNVSLANDSLEQTGGPNNAAATIPPLFGGEVPTDADILKESRRKAMSGPTLKMRKEDSEFSDRFGPKVDITSGRARDLLNAGVDPSEWGFY